MNKWFELAKIFGTMAGLVFVAYGFSKSYLTILFGSGLIILTTVYAMVGFTEEINKEKSSHKKLIESLIFAISIISLYIFLLLFSGGI